MTLKSHNHYEDLVRQILVELRGNQTQKSLSQSLGYKFNQWHKWESGEKSLSWLEFIKILDFFEIQIASTLKKITKNNKIQIQNPHLILQDIFNLYCGKDHSFIAKKLTISKSSLLRNLKSNKNVPAYLIFQSLGEFTSTLYILIEAIIGKKNFKKFTKGIQQTRQQFNIEALYPWLSAIEAFLETKNYLDLKKHNAEIISKHLGLPVEAVHFGLDLLLKNESVEIQKGKYILKEKRIDLETSIECSAQFAKFWMQASQKRFTTTSSVPLSQGGWSCRVFPVSSTALEKIKILRKKFNTEFQEILQKDFTDPKEHVQVFTLNIFDSTEFPLALSHIKIPKNET